MTPFKSLRGGGRLLALAAALIAVFIYAGLSHAQVGLGTADAPESLDLGKSPLTAITPYALFQYSTLTGSGNTITATQVPLVTSTGTIVYDNITLQFNVSSSGMPSLAAGFPKVVPSVIPVTSGFRAGRYVGPSSILGGNAIITVSGPAVAPGGATEWSLATAAGASSSTYPGTGEWYVGSLANNPVATRIKAAGITSTALSYGIASSSACGYWCTNDLIGVSQIGNTITFYNFTTGGRDQDLPVDQITYTLAP